MIDLKLVCCTARTYLAKAKKCEKVHVTPDENDSSTALLPVAITALVAAIGIAGMVFVFVTADRVPEGGAGMQSTNAISRAGATITPTVPAPRLPRSITIANEARQDL